MDAERLVLVIVPAYNEGRVVTATVERLLAAGYQVVVVDDGSSDETVEVRHLPIVYLRHPVNLGQGAALQTGMTYALRAGADIAVHFDADGQHDCGQIEHLIAPIVEGRADVVFGSRFLRQQDCAQVPWKKRILLRGGILISWVMTGMLLSDTHNGFRAMSRRALERCSCRRTGSPMRRRSCSASARAGCDTSRCRLRSATRSIRSRRGSDFRDRSVFYST